MSLLDTLQSDIKEAMKAKEVVARDALRLLLASLKNTAIDSGKDIAKLTDEEIVVVIRREIKRRKESIAAFTEGGRDELVASEQAEVDLFEKYVPAQMSAEDVDKAVAEAIAEAGDGAQFGQVMGAVMKKVGGQADGNLVNERVKTALS